MAPLVAGKTYSRRRKVLVLVKGLKPLIWVHFFFPLAGEGGEEMRER